MRWPEHDYGDSGAPNNKAGYSYGKMSTFQTSPGFIACIRYRHRVPAPVVMIWAANEYTARTSLVWIIGNLNAHFIGTFLRSYVQWLCPVQKACQEQLLNQIMQDKMLHVAFWSSSIHRVFDCCLGLHSVQICHLLKTSGRGLQRAWPAPPLQLIQLMKCGIWNSLEAAWNELNSSVIQVQFDSMLNRVQTVLAAAVSTNLLSL